MIISITVCMLCAQFKGVQDQCFTVQERKAIDAQRLGCIDYGFMLRTGWWESIRADANVFASHKIPILDSLFFSGFRLAHVRRSAFDVGGATQDCV